MTDLERLFRRLVDNLIAIDPARLHRPLTIADLLGSVIPYRTTRRALAIDSAEDYDMLVLQLCAGEGGYVRMQSDDITQVLRDQVTSPNPDLDVLREHKRAELVLQTEPLAHALGPGPEEAFAPPETDDFYEEPEPPNRQAADASGSIAPLGTTRPAAEPPVRRMPFSAEPAAPMVPPPPRITAEPSERTPPPRLRMEDSTRCSFCGGKLPAGRTVNFCPHCGQNQSVNKCPECQSDLEIGWKHCVSCGHATGEG